MIEIVQRIFKEKEFQVNMKFNASRKISKYFFAQRESQNYFDFYLVIEVFEETLLTEELDREINKFYDEILSASEIRGIEKNLSLLIIVAREEINYTNEFSKLVYHYEEDPFKFKKYILPYTNEQQDILLGELQSDKDIIEQLDLIINYKNYFNVFKKQSVEPNDEESKLYDIVSKLFIKLPILMLTTNEKNLTNLSEEIREEIPDNDRKIIDAIFEVPYDEIKWNGILELLEVDANEL